MFGKAWMVNSDLISDFCIYFLKFIASCVSGIDKLKFFWKTHICYHYLQSVLARTAMKLCPCPQISLILTHWKTSWSDGKCDKCLKAWIALPQPRGTKHSTVMSHSDVSFNSDVFLTALQHEVGFYFLNLHIFAGI